MKILFFTSFLLLLSPAWLQTNQTLLEQKAEKFSTLLVAEKFDSLMPYFDSSVSSKIDSKKLAEIWTQLQSQVGNYLTKGSVRTIADKKSSGTIQPLEFERGLLDLKLFFAASEKITGFFFVPHEEVTLELIETDAFFETEITVEADKNFPLRGILTAPKNKSNVPALILVHGSGAQDMDETVSNHKLFKDLAHGLAEKGIAVIRYDKRTKVYGGSPKLAAESITLETETIDDALAAVKLALKNPLIDAKNIFVLGHSLGGMSAPLIASKSKHTKGIIILAGNARPLQDVVKDQYMYLFNENGVISPEEQKTLNDYDQQLKNLEKLAHDKKAQAGTLPLGLPAKYWRYLLDYNQVETAKNLNKPILILQGERDYQVTMKDFETWKQNLGKDGNFTYQSYKKLNHLFFEGEGKSYPSEYLLPGQTPDYLINDIATWILLQK